MPALQPVNGRIRFLAVLITPGTYPDMARVVAAGPPGLPGRCISACTGRVVQAGGWDSRAKRSRPMEPLIPVGSTWFYEAAASDLSAVQALHGENFGDPYGFGQILIGSWEE